MATLNERSQEIIDHFKRFSDWESRYKEIMNWGKELAPYPEEFRSEKYKVKGCQSQVWLYPEYKNGIVTFYGDSDAAIVKGIVALLLKTYSPATPAEIMQFKPDFLKEIGIVEHLSMNRSNGLQAMTKQIHLYAFAFNAMK